MSELNSLAGYDDFLHDLKQQIHTARTRAALAVNQELVLLYWRIGMSLSDRMREHGWGAKVVDQISVDLHYSFPETKVFLPETFGICARSLKLGRMKQFCNSLLQNCLGGITLS